ncbi:MAG: dihydroneopterin aldolase [Ginsengibacter sp.]
MITVQLHQLLFHAYHGVHEEEEVLGNEYMVDCSVEFYETAEVITHINDTVNYVHIYDIIKKRMSIPTQLLETIAMEIGNEIIREYKELKVINITIRKLHPPIEGIRGSVGIAWNRKF